MNNSTTIEETYYTQMENGDHFIYNKGSMRPYRCLFCDRCYKYEVCLQRHFTEMHLKFFQLCQQQMKVSKKTIQRKEEINMINFKPIRISVIVENHFQSHSDASCYDSSSSYDSYW